ncbi:dihydrofolate reductase family protein [Streptomyces sp. CA-251247]|uniref:dihydrofolate reductase family protein n=1 Tax=Streptomyces sp. CA-251247 TaxID=3240062 RepID=UPI003D8EBD27
MPLLAVVGGPYPCGEFTPKRRVFRAISRWRTGRTKAACDRDIRIAGGAETIQEYLDRVLIDEFSITLAPMLLGTGIRLSDRVDPARLGRLDPLSANDRLTTGRRC